MNKKIEILSKRGVMRIALSTKEDKLILRVTDLSSEAEIELGLPAVEMLHSAIQEYFGGLVVKMKLPPVLGAGLGRRFDWMHYPSSEEEIDEEEPND